MLLAVGVIFFGVFTVDDEMALLFVRNWILRVA
jgi:hypothetical protein